MPFLPPNQQHQSTEGKTLTPNCSKNVGEIFFAIIGIFDEVRGEEHEYGQKTGPEVVFAAILVKN